MDREKIAEIVCRTLDEKQQLRCSSCRTEFTWLDMFDYVEELRAELLEAQKGREDLVCAIADWERLYTSAREVNEQLRGTLAKAKEDRHKLATAAQRVVQARYRSGTDASWETLSDAIGELSDTLRTGRALCPHCGMDMEAEKEVFPDQAGHRCRGSDQ